MDFNRHLTQRITSTTMSTPIEVSHSRAVDTRWLFVLLRRVIRAHGCQTSRSGPERRIDREIASTLRADTAGPEAECVSKRHDMHQLPRRARKNACSSSAANSFDVEMDGARINVHTVLAFSPGFRGNCIRVMKPSVARAGRESPSDLSYSGSRCAASRCSDIISDSCGRIGIRVPTSNI